MLKKSTAYPLILALSLIAFACAASNVNATKSGSAIESIYTDTIGSKCRTTFTDQESGSSEQRCPGVGGYGLEVLDGDSRMSVTVIAPGGKRHPLDLWTVVSTAFSSIGEKAEWRVTHNGKKVTPVALIIRFNASENPDDPYAQTSYLAVAKITPQQICVTDRIAPSSTANEEARRAADIAASRQCLPNP